MQACPSRLNVGDEVLQVSFRRIIKFQKPFLLRTPISKGQGQFLEAIAQRTLGMRYMSSNRFTFLYLVPYARITVADRERGIVSIKKRIHHAN